MVFHAQYHADGSLKSFAAIQRCGRVRYADEDWHIRKAMQMTNARFNPFFFFSSAASMSISRCGRQATTTLLWLTFWRLCGRTVRAVAMSAWAMTRVFVTRCPPSMSASRMDASRLPCWKSSSGPSRMPILPLTLFRAARSF